MPGLADLYAVGGGIPAAPEGSLPVGAADAMPGTRLYEIAKMIQRQQQRRPRVQPQVQPQAAGGYAPQGRARDRQAGMDAQQRQADVLASLISKATPGAAAPGEGMIPFGDLPPQIQLLAGKAHGQPLVGFDPGKLSTEERYMLERLRRMNQASVSQRVDANPQYQQGPYGAMPGAGGGV